MNEERKAFSMVVKLHSRTGQYDECYPQNNPQRMMIDL